MQECASYFLCCVLLVDLCIFGVCVRVCMSLTLRMSVSHFRLYHTSNLFVLLNCKVCEKFS